MGNEKQLLTLSEAAEFLGLSEFEVKVSRQRGLPPGRLGFVEQGNLLFRRSDLLDRPKAERSRPKPESWSEYPKHIGGGYYELSDGSTVRGKRAAERAEDSL